MTVRPLIHIGWQKTGSTWLQKTVFEQKNPVFKEPCKFTYGVAHEHFIYRKKFQFCPNSARAAFEPGIKACEEQGLIPVISNENLVGNPLVPYAYAKETADRIYQTFPNARILIFVREPKDIIAALYRQHIKQGNRTTIQEFLISKYQKAGFWPVFIPERLEYDELIAYYMDLFGPQSVLVLAFEEFKQSNAVALRKILNFVGVAEDSFPTDTVKPEVNIGYRGLTLEFRRRMNYFLPKPSFGGDKPSLSFRVAGQITRAFDKLVPKSVNKLFDDQMKAVINEFVADRYLESNLRLKELTGITFEKNS